MPSFRTGVLTGGSLLILYNYSLLTPLTVASFGTGVIVGLVGVIYLLASGLLSLFDASVELSPYLSQFYRQIMQGALRTTNYCSSDVSVDAASQMLNELLAQSYRTTCCPMNYGQQEESLRQETPNEETFNMETFNEETSNMETPSEETPNEETLNEVENTIEETSETQNDVVDTVPVLVEDVEPLTPTEDSDSEWQ